MIEDANVIRIVQAPSIRAARTYQQKQTEQHRAMQPLPAEQD